MKVKKGYVLRKVADEHVVITLGEATANFNGLIKLNSTGVFLWKLLEEGTTSKEMAEKLASEYDIDYKTASKDVQIFLASLQPANCLED